MVGGICTDKTRTENTCQGVQTFYDNTVDASQRSVVNN